MEELNALGEDDALAEIADVEVGNKKIVQEKVV